MKQKLSYGRISWSYEDSYERPTPLVHFKPIRINGTLRIPRLSDRDILFLLKWKTSQTHSFEGLYSRWYKQEGHKVHDIGESRSFLMWVQKKNYSIAWRKGDFSIHPCFTDPEAPKHDPHDELAEEHIFAIRPVEVNNRKIKLYIQDDDVLGLIHLPYGEEEDFLELVKKYVALRFHWEKWRAPAPTFLDWVKAQGKRPLFSRGQMGMNRDFQS